MSIIVFPAAGLQPAEWQLNGAPEPHAAFAKRAASGQAASKSPLRRVQGPALPCRGCGRELRGPRGLLLEMECYETGDWTLDQWLDVIRCWRCFKLRHPAARFW